MVRKNRKRNKRNKANGKAEPKKPNNGEKGVPEKLKEHVDPGLEEDRKMIEAVEKPEELVAVLKDDSVIAEVLGNVLDDVEKVQEMIEVVEKPEELVAVLNDDPVITDVLMVEAEKDPKNGKEQLAEQEVLMAKTDSELESGDEPGDVEKPNVTADVPNAPKVVKVTDPKNEILVEVRKDPAEKKTVKAKASSKSVYPKLKEEDMFIPKSFVGEKREAIADMLSQFMAMDSDEEEEAEAVEEDFKNEHSEAGDSENEDSEDAGSEDEPGDVEEPNVAAAISDLAEVVKVKDPEIGEILVESGGRKDPAKRMIVKTKAPSKPYPKLKEEDMFIPKSFVGEKREAIADMLSQFMAMDSSDEEEMETLKKDSEDVKSEDEPGDVGRLNVTAAALEPVEVVTNEVKDPKMKDILVEDLKDPAEEKIVEAKAPSKSIHPKLEEAVNMLIPFSDEEKKKAMADMLTKFMAMEEEEAETLKYDSAAKKSKDEDSEHEPVEVVKVKDPKIGEILVESEDRKEPAKGMIVKAKAPSESVHPKLKEEDMLIPKGFTEEQTKAIALMLAQFMAMDSSDEDEPRDVVKQKRVVKVKHPKIEKMKDAVHMLVPFSDEEKKEAMNDTLPKFVAVQESSDEEETETLEADSEDEISDSDSGKATVKEYKAWLKDEEEDWDRYINQLIKDDNPAKSPSDNSTKTSSEVTSTSSEKTTTPSDSSTTTSSESSDDEEADMKFLDELVEKHGIKGAMELLTSLLVPPHKRMKPAPPVPQDPSKRIFGPAAPRPTLKSTLSVPIDQPCSKKPETGQLVRRSKPPPSATPIVRPPVPQDTNMSFSDDDDYELLPELLPELRRVRTARWVEASKADQDPNDYADCVMTKMEGAEATEDAEAAQMLTQPAQVLPFPTAPEFVPPKAIVEAEEPVEKPAESPISGPTSEVSSSDSKDSDLFEKKVVVNRHRVKTKKFAPSMRFKMVQPPASHDSNESEKSLLSTGPKSSLMGSSEEADQGSEMAPLLSEQSNFESIILSDQLDSESDVPEEKVSHGQKYQRLDQDDGWKVPKQLHNWNIRSWGALIAVIVALVAMSSFRSSELPRVTRNAPTNNPAQSFDSIHHKSAMLARLMNGIYLQNELTNGSFPIYDFVAEAGGIGDPAMLNKIMSLKAKDAVTRMESIRGFELIRPNGVEDKLNTLSRFTSAKPTGVLDKTQSDALFKSLATMSTDVPQVFATTEVDELITKLADLDAGLGTADGNSLGVRINVVSSSTGMLGQGLIQTRLPKFIADFSSSKVKDDVKPLDLLADEVAFLEQFSQASGDLRVLQSQLADLKADADVLDPFMAGKDNADTQATLKSVLDFLQSVDDHLTPKLFIAFSKSTSIIGNFTIDFSNDWMRKVLNEKNDLSVLEKTLEPLINATEQVKTVVNTWNSGIRPSLIQTITADCKKLDTIIAIKPKSGHIVTSVDNIEGLLSALKLIPDLADSTKIIEMKAKLVELTRLVDDLLKDANALAQDPKFTFFINKDTGQLQFEVKGKNAADAKALVDGHADLLAIRTNAQYVSSKMKGINVKVVSFVSFLGAFASYQTSVDNGRTWLTGNNPKDFFDKAPAVNEDIAIVKRMLDLVPKAAPNNRRKRAASVELIALADELAKLGSLKATVDKLKDPSNQNKKTVELKKLSSARQMAAELAYAAGALNAYTAIQKDQADIKTINNFAKAVDAEIAKLPPKDQAEVHIGWPGADKVTATFTALQPQVKKLPAALDKVKADATLNDFADVLAVLDKVPVVKLDVTAILKSLELLKTKSNNAKAVVDVSTALKKFEGLSFASGRKKGALPPMVKKLHAFFFDFFGLVLPTTTEAPIPPIEVPFFLIIFFIAGPPGGIWLYLWFRWIQKMKRDYRELPTEEQASVKEEPKKSVKEEKPEPKPKSEKKSVKEPVVEPEKEHVVVLIGEPVLQPAPEVPDDDDPMAVEPKDEKEKEKVEQKVEQKVETEEDEEPAMEQKRRERLAKKLDEKAQLAKADKRNKRHEDRMKETIRRKRQKVEKHRREALRTAVKAKTIYIVDKKHKSYWKRQHDRTPVLVWKKTMMLKKKKKKAKKAAKKAAKMGKKPKKPKKVGLDEEPIWHKVPFNDLTPIPSLISYNSDDLRSANTDTDSTGLPLTQWYGSTCSDRTQLGDNERVLRQDEMPQPKQMAKARMWQNIINSWATTNVEKLQGFKSPGHYKAYRNWIVRLKQKIADMEAKEEELRQEIAYNRTVDKWKAMLAANKDEIEVKKQDYKRRADEDAETERKNTEIMMKAKKLRTPGQNVCKYISESYCSNPDREYCIVEIAWRSVDPIDNFILSYRHDKYEHLFRTHTSKYVHDWARMRFIIDSPYDYEYYDAGLLYPWGEHYEEIMDQYKNLLAVASAPMFPYASAIFWHMMFCNKVPMLVMLNQMVERTFQTVHPFFPLRPGDEKRFKYNKRRQYIVKCLEIKTIYKKNGIERLLEITPIVDRQRGPPLLMVFIHMLDWPQEGIPLKWKNYVDLCERIKDMSTNNPVMLMSMHGCGRAATLACALMAAILIPIEDDSGVHVLVHGARATKRSSMTCELQVYFWRMVSYELLFRWFPESKKYRVNMSVRDEVWEDAIVGYLTDYKDVQDEFFELMYTWEYDRFDRHYFGHRHMRKMLKMKRRNNFEKVQAYTYLAREAQEAVDEHAPYRNGEIIRRKFLRAWDPPRDPNRKKRVYVEADILRGPMERVQSRLGIYPLLCKKRPTGLYRWIYPSKQAEIDARGMPQPGNYKEFCHMTEANKAEWERRRKRQRLMNPRVVYPPEEFAHIKFLPNRPNDRHLLTSNREQEEKEEEEEPEKERPSRWDKWIRPPRHHPRKYFEKTPPREYVPSPRREILPGTLPPRAPPPSRDQSEEPKATQPPSDKSAIYTAPRGLPVIDPSEPLPPLINAPAKDLNAAPAPPKPSSPVASKVSKVATPAAPVEKTKESNASEVAPAAPTKDSAKKVKASPATPVKESKESNVSKVAPAAPTAPAKESEAPPSAPSKAPSPVAAKPSKASKVAPAAPVKESKAPPSAPSKASSPAAAKASKASKVAPAALPTPKGSKPPTKAPAKTPSPAPPKNSKVAPTAPSKASTPAAPKASNAPKASATAPAKNSKPANVAPAAPTKGSKGSNNSNAPTPTPKGSKNAKTPAKPASKGAKAKK